MVKKKIFLEIGKIVATHGVKGFVKISGWCDDVNIFKKLSLLYFDENGLFNRKIKEVKFKKSLVLILFEDVNNLEEAKKLIGEIVYVNRKDIKLKDDEIFIQDLIGMKVYDFLNRDLFYGEIVDVLQTGANDIYKIIDEKGTEKYVPAIKEVVIEKNIEKNEIYIKLLEGLFDV